MMNWFNSITPDQIMYVVLASIMIFCAVYMYRLQKDERSPVDVMDLVMENGKLSESKFIRFITWLVSTWGFIYLIASHSLTEWYFIGYMSAWVANALFDKSTKPNLDNK
jgi:hypothetical protein